MLPKYCVLKSVEVGVAVEVVVEGAVAGVGMEDSDCDCDCDCVCVVCGKVKRTGLVETDLALRLVNSISGFPWMEVINANTFPSFELLLVPELELEPEVDSMKKRELSFERLES